NRSVLVTHEWRKDNVAPVDVALALGESASGLTDMFLQLTDTLAIEDVTTYEWTRKFVNDYLTAQARSLLVVPLLDEAVLVGALLVAMADTPRSWCEADILLVEAVAAQTRTSVDLAQLLQREHNIAERLQEALKPSLPAHTPGMDLDYFYQPALSEASIGGDFFDVFPVHKAAVALVVGDLSGKGLAAASQIATLRNMLRFALYQGQELSKALQELNEVLVGHHLLQGFATLFVGLYDLDEKTLTYVSCGHETALLRRSGGDIIDQLEPNSPIVGAFAGAEFFQETWLLNPGDTLLVYTDGVSEAGRSRHEFLGVEGLAKIVANAPTNAAASDYIRGVVAGVEAHNRGTFHDDQCLVAAVIQAN
ncbi:MAG: GAF domain-containing SpoIIE family protein phosphatase, partial [Armatimonadota bacterium]